MNKVCENCKWFKVIRNCGDRPYFECSCPEEMFRVPIAIGMDRNDTWASRDASTCTFWEEEKA